MEETKCKPKIINNTQGGALYFLGFIGAAFYYISNTTGVQNIILGLLKALVWPAFLVFNLFKFFGL